MSPLPAVTPTRTTTTEAELFIGYRVPLRTEECVCGGEITAPENDWGQIAAEVRLHSLSKLHQDYRAGRVPRPAQPTDRDAVRPIDLSRDRGEGLSAAQSGASE